MHRHVPFAFLAVLATWPVYAQAPTQSRAEGVTDRGTQEMFLAGRQWDLLGGGYHLTGDSTVDSLGTVYFTDVSRNRILKIDLDGAIKTLREKIPTAHMAWHSARMAACTSGSSSMTLRRDGSGRSRSRRMAR